MNTRTLVTFALVSTTWIACGPCDPDAVARSVAGNDAIDCGRVAVGLSSERVDTCAVAAFRAGMPFFLRQDLTGLDSEIAEYFVRDSRGSMYRLFWDRGISTNGAFTGARVTQQVCADPVVTVRDGFEQIACTPTGPTRQICGP